METITTLLDRASNGDHSAMDEVMKTVNADLEAAAERFMRARYGNALAGATLEPAALVNETYIKLLAQRSDYQNQAHFLGIATRVMLRVLADYERGKKRLKRGGKQLRVTLSGIGSDFAQPDDFWLDQFAGALDQLGSLDSRTAEVARLCLVWGFTASEASETLGTSSRTVERDLRFARAWLQDALEEA